MELQSQVRDLQADKVTTEEEVKDVTGRFNEVMELQRRLRTAGVKDTNRHIDASLQRLAATEAQEERDMIKHYLTESSYADFNSSSVQAYFRAKSISFKADLTASVIRTAATDQFGDEKGPEQALDSLIRHDVVSHFDYIHTYAEQFWTAMASCTLDEFVKAGHLFQEFESVLRTVEGCMSSLKRDELNLKDTLESARGSYNVLGAVYRSNAYLSNARPDSTIILHVSVIRASLERIRSAFDAVKTFVSRVEPVYENVEDHVNLDAFAEPAQTATEALNMVTKFSTVLNALQKDGLYPSLPDGIESLVEINESLDRFANKAQENAVTFIRLVLSKLAKEPEGVDAAMMSTQIDTLFKKDLLGEVQSSLTDARSRIGKWHEHASVLNNCLEVQLQPAPWAVKAQQIEAEKKQSIESEKKLQLMTTELHSALLQVRERQETIDTKELEIEHLKARNQEAAVKAGTIETLQADLDKARSERETHRSDAETLRAEIARLEREGVSRPDDTSNTVPATPQPTRERPEIVEAPQANTSSSVATLVKALTDENQWLRQRENSDVLSHDLDAVFTKSRTDRAVRAKAEARHKQALAAEMLDMAFTSHLMGVQGSVTRPLELRNDGLAAGEDSKGEGRAVQQRSQRKGGPVFPLTLATGTELLAYVDDLSFMDLSPVAEAFACEVGGY
jgi:dynactin 1